MSFSDTRERFILGVGTIILSEDIHNYNLCVVRIFKNQTLHGLIRNFSFIKFYEKFPPIQIF